MIVSIITVVFNGAKTLEQTIQSVLNQTYKNFEYIIIDGGSTDGTIEVIKKYEKHISFWISEPDKGLYDAMNKGIGFANGEIIGMINSDDWYEPNAIEIIIEAYKLHPEKRIFHGDRFDILENGTKRIRKFNPSRLKFLYYGMTYNHPSMFVHRDKYQDDLYNINLKSHSDYQFVLESFLNNPNIFLYIPITITNYRLDGVSANMPWVESSKALYKIRRKLGFSIIEAGGAFLIMRLSSIWIHFKKRMKNVV